MKYWLRGKRGGFLAFLLISALVIGGLGGVTVTALRVEREQFEDRTQRELYDKLRLALWRMDSFVAPALAKEDGRPYNHYSALFAPPHVLRLDNDTWQRGTVLEPSPLLSAELPDWMLLHFQADEELGWRSPQVLTESLARRLQNAKDPDLIANATPQRRQLLLDLTQHLEAKTLASCVQEQSNRPSLPEVTLELSNNFAMDRNNNVSSAAQGGNPSGYLTQQQPQAVDQEYLNRSRQVQTGQARKGGKAQNEDANVANAENILRNGETWLPQPQGKPVRSEQVSIELGRMGPLWLSSGGEPKRLLFVRRVMIGPKEVCQGIVLDWPRLRELLAQEVIDLFPDARIEPVPEGMPIHSERTMSALPLQLEPGTLAAVLPDPSWTPLRAGLVLACSAALVALLAVGLGGWSLLDLSERRIRFVSAVTHELRTPLTTLRLYLDMLAGGMVREEKQKEEYLHTLNSEADRLNRLVGNVLDFSRLENQRPRLAKTKLSLGDLLEQVRSTWQGRCQSAAKELIIENAAGEVSLFTDCQLVQQILGNLIDNACKYSRDAVDCRIWLRAHNQGRQLMLEVEDRGPGVPPRERRSIFRPFRRGKGIDATAGGVGLGLALAYRWAQLLGGKLTIRSGRETAGACFRLALPRDRSVAA
jgi:two-component sensor histidine kinase